MQTEKRRPKLPKMAAISLALTALALCGHAQGPLEKLHPIRDDGPVRRELTADYERMADAVRRKDAAALSAFIRDTTTPGLLVKLPNGSPMPFLDLTVPVSERRGFDRPLTQALLLKDLPAAGRELENYHLTVESAAIHIDKLVVFGDTALVLTTGQGAGAQNDGEAHQDLSLPKRWSSFKYRDCETWTRTPHGWKLREVYLVAYMPDSWRLQTLQDKYIKPYLGF